MVASAAVVAVGGLALETFPAGTVALVVAGAVPGGVGVLLTIKVRCPGTVVLVEEMVVVG